MTVPTTVNKTVYTGTGANTALATTFSFIDAADLIVTRRVTSTGVETTMALTTDYTVTGGNYKVGTVTVVDGATDFPTTVTWTIERNTAQTQNTDYVANDNFAAESHEQALDKGVYISQDQQDEINRALKVPVSDGALNVIPNSVDRANNVLSFDSTGQPVTTAITLIDSGVTVTAFMETVMDDVDAAAARTTLGAASSTGFVRTYTTKTGNYSALTTDDIILCNDSGATGFTITMPVVATGSGNTWVLKRIDASATTITIATADSALIDGAATNTDGLIAQYDIVTISCDGSAWHILS